ncbi:MAG: hypothetical protein LEGION0398_MBIBDBAK_00332 [Legionellaceae bacterium]
MGEIFENTWNQSITFSFFKNVNTLVNQKAFVFLNKTIFPLMTLL